MNKLKVPNYLLTLQSPVLAENTETICGVCHNLALTELIDSQYELSDMEVLEIARKRFSILAILSMMILKGVKLLKPVF